MRRPLPAAVLLALAAAAACVVPSIGELGDKRCDLDAGHPCVSGYSCIAGLCKVPQGGSCAEGARRPCGSDAGTCRPGTQSCGNGTWGPCEGEVGPGAEACDGRDNDCDGTPDNNLTGAPPCDRTQGVCLGATQACVDGGWAGPCGAAQYGADYEGTESRCDGKDNDCDGTTDVGVTGGACPAQGVCAGFTRACVLGAPGVCQAPGYEATEASCDARDNDCDGQVDEGVVGSGSCSRTQGVCAGKRPACVDGGFEPACTAASYGADYEDVERLCDGRDNDCDGRTDRLADGGFVRVGTCELSQGVCAGAQRACVAGNGEAPCTAASYGAQYARVEFTCEGLDNDCDGQVDRSVEVPLLLTPNATSTHLGLAPGAAGFGAAYADQRGASSRVFFRLFDLALQPLANEVELTDPAALQASRPVITRLGQDFAVAWREEHSTGWRVVLARVTPPGSLAWRRTVAAEQAFTAPVVATSASPERAFVAWSASPGLTLRAAAWDGAGNVVVPAMSLTALPDAGGEQVFDVDVARRAGAGDLVVGWVAFVASEFRVRFRAYSDTLAPSGSVRELSFPGETARDVQVAPFGATGEVAGAWIGAVGSSQATVRYTTNALQATQSPQVAASVAGSMTDLALVGTPAGGAAFWSQGLPQPRLFARSLVDGGVVDVSPSGVLGLFGAEATLGDGGVVALGYESDRGQGLDLHGQLICLP